MKEPLGTVANRIAGALVGLGVGAAAAPSGTGGGGTRWGSGESRLAVALAQVYVGGYSLSEAAQSFLATVDGGYELDPISRSALARYRCSGDARRCGMAAVRPDSVESAPLGRCLAIGLARVDRVRRAREAAEVTAITHPQPRSVDSCVAYCELVAALVAGAAPAGALAGVAGHGQCAEVGAVLEWAPRLPASWLCPGNALAAGVWALGQPGAFGEILEQLAGLGAGGPVLVAAGGLLGAARGLGAIPEPMVRSLPDYRALLGLAPQLLLGRRRQRVRRCAPARASR